MALLLATSFCHVCRPQSLHRTWSRWGAGMGKHGKLHAWSWSFKTEWEVGSGAIYSEPFSPTLLCLSQDIPLPQHDNITRHSQQTEQMWETKRKQRETNSGAKKGRIGTFPIKHSVLPAVEERSEELGEKKAWIHSLSIFHYTKCSQ